MTLTAREGGEGEGRLSSHCSPYYCPLIACLLISSLRFWISAAAFFCSSAELARVRASS